MWCRMFLGVRPLSAALLRSFQDLRQGVLRACIIIFTFDCTSVVTRKHSGQNDVTMNFTVMRSLIDKPMAISTFSPVSSLSSNGLTMRVCACLCIVRNELIRGYASVVYTLSSFRPHTYTRPHTHTQVHTHTHYDTHILIPFEDRKPTGLKVVIAEAHSTRLLSLSLIHI